MIRILIMRMFVAAFEGTQGPVLRRDEPGRRLRERRSLGLTQAVLQGIRTDVFNVAVPIGP